MTKFIHTVSAGSSSWFADGTIFGVSHTTQQLETSDLDNASFVEAEIGMAKIPDDIVPVIGSILGTPLSAGTGNSDFADQSELESGMVFPPTPGTYFDGTTWAGSDGAPAGIVTGISIVTAGTLYSTSTDNATLATNESEVTGTGLLVDVTSVDGSGGVTGVSVGTSGGGRYKVGDQIGISAANGNAIVEVTSVDVPVIGTMNTGRGVGAGPNDMSPSYFPRLPLDLPADQIYLIIPATNARINYNASIPHPYTHDSFGDVFDGVDFTIEVHAIGIGKIAELICPDAAPNVDVDFGRFIA